MDETSPAGEQDLRTPDQWGELASVSARAVARDHPHRWAATGLPDSLAPLDISMQTTWAAVQLALSGADHDTLARTLGLTDQTARHIIIATTEQLVVTRHAAPSTPTPSTPTPSTPALLSGLRIDPLSCQRVRAEQER